MIQIMVPSLRMLDILSLMVDIELESEGALVILFLVGAIVLFMYSR